MPNYPVNHGGRDNGGTAAFFHAARSGRLWPWDWTPEFCWECRIDAADLRGSAATQRTTITIPSTDFVSGRLTVTFSGGGLSSPVSVTADASVLEDQNDLGDSLEAAITTAIGTTLAGVVDSVNNAAAANAVVVVFERGIGAVTVAASFEPAQVTEVQFGGTVIDGAYRLRFECDDPNADTTATVTRAAGTPANVAAMAVEMETAAEALIAGDLADILVSADDDGVDTNVLQFEPGVEVTVTATPAPGTSLTFGGTATDGAYVTTVTHSSIPGGSAAVTTTRVGGTPATNANLAAQHEADLEADPRLASLIASADDTGAVNTVLGFAGVTGMTFSTSAPDPGTLTSAPPTMTVTDATPAGPTVTVSHSVVLDLNSLGARGRFPHHVMRDVVALEVDVAFGVGRTITVGQGDGEATLLGSAAAVTLNSTGRTLALATATHYRTRYQATMVPTATIVLGSSLTVSTGRAYVQIDYAPHPSMTADAA